MLLCLIGCLFLTWCSWAGYFTRRMYALSAFFRSQFCHFTFLYFFAPQYQRSQLFVTYEPTRFSKTKLSFLQIKKSVGGNIFCPQNLIKADAPAEFFPYVAVLLQQLDATKHQRAQGQNPAQPPREVQSSAKERQPEILPWERMKMPIVRQQMKMLLRWITNKVKRGALRRQENWRF